MGSLIRVWKEDPLAVQPVEETLEEFVARERENALIFRGLQNSIFVLDSSVLASGTPENHECRYWLHKRTPFRIIADSSENRIVASSQMFFVPIEQILRISKNALG